MAKNDIVTVNEGGTYENNATKDRVVAWHVDMGRVVRYSPQSIGSGREYRMPVGEFLENFTEVEEKQPAAKINNPDGTEKNSK